MKKDKYSHAEKELRGLKLYIRNVKDRIRKDYSRTKWLVAYADRIDIRICWWNRRRHTCVVIVYDNYLWKKYHIDPYRAAATWYDKIPDDTYQPVILHMDTNGHCLGYYKIWDCDLIKYILTINYKLIKQNYQMLLKIKTQNWLIPKVNEKQPQIFCVYFWN